MFQMGSILYRLPRGTVVTIVMDSGNIIGPATIQEHYPLQGMVALLEQGDISPPGNTITYIHVGKVESVSYSGPVTIP